MVLSPFLPSYPNTFFPPQFLFEFPGDHNLRIWEDLVRSESDKLKSKREFVLNCYQDLGLPDHNRIWAFNQIHPSYSNISKGYFADKEIDFGGQMLQSWEHYLGPMVRTESDEKDHKLVDLFISHALNKKKKIIYVSLGTVINSLLSNNVLVRFFTMIFNIASARTDWIFIVKVPKSTGAELKLKSLNVLMVNYSPQLKILKHADMMVTHGGGSSIYEALNQEVPMLIIPPKDVFDYNGNAARMVYLGVGKHMTFHANHDTLEYNIEQVLSNPAFTLNAVKWSSYLNRNYPPDYLERMDNVLFP